MLLAVEGGGFFSSSATGYSKGLTLLFLGRKNEEKPMRVSPWKQYQLVEDKIDPAFQLAPVKNHVPQGCPAFICFGRASPRLEDPSSLKVGPIQQQEELATKPSITEDCGAPDHVENENGTKICLRSSLKKPSDCPPTVPGEEDQVKALDENGSNAPECTERRKVQWTDACGKDLAEIREFELSDMGDEDLGGENYRSCGACSIM
ncbi:hypothetical protein ACHQM5_022134 [Ranunculus cassubicifolius]